MQKIFIGMLLVFLNFNINVGASKIGLIPDFIGYFYMLKGACELWSFSRRFSEITSYITGMTGFSALCYVVDLFGISAYTNLPITLFLGLISTFLSLFISYKIIMGIKEIELNHGEDLNSGQLYSTWQISAVCSLLSFALFFSAMLVAIGAIVAFIAKICYLYLFHKTKNLFYERIF